LRQSLQAIKGKNNDLCRETKLRMKGYTSSETGQMRIVEQLLPSTEKIIFNTEFYTITKCPFKMKGKCVFRYTTAERIHSYQTCTIRNVKEILQSQGK
jgi:hypothetical protein